MIRAPVPALPLPVHLQAAIVASVVATLAASPAFGQADAPASAPQASHAKAKAAAKKHRKAKAVAVRDDDAPDSFVYGRRDDVLAFAAQAAEDRGLDRAWVEDQLSRARYQSAFRPRHRYRDLHARCPSRALHRQPPPLLPEYSQVWTLY